MEDIILNLQINFNEAVELFNAGNYNSFLQKIRTAIEYLSQYMIYTIAGKYEAEEILDGMVSFYFNKDSRCFKKSEADYGRQPHGKDLPLLINKVYSCYKNKPDNAIAGYSEALCGYYSITSNWSHSGSRTYNESIQAICCASLISAFFDYIDVNKIISERDFQVLKSLNQFDLENENTVEKYKNEINKDRQYIKGLEESKKVLEDRITNRNREYLQLQQSNETLKKEYEARITELTNQLEKKDIEIAETLQSAVDLEHQINLQKKSDNNKDEIKKLQKQIESLNKALADKETLLAETNKQLVIAKEEIREKKREELEKQKAIREAEKSSEKNKKAQDDFEQYIVSLFGFERHRCFERIESDPTQNQPKIIVDLTTKYYETKFAVAVQYITKISNDGFCLQYEDLKAYRDYKKRIDGSIYLALGVGGNPNNPKQLYLIPLEKFKKNKYISKSALKEYLQSEDEGTLRYNPETDELYYYVRIT